MKDPYEVLGVTKGASKDDIRKAYRELVKRYHPDKFQSNSDMLKLAEEKMKEINEAYTYLLNHDDGDTSSTSTYSTDDDGIYAQVRQKMQSGDLYGAEDLLIKISDKTNPDWYFLNGIIYAQRGWYDKAYEYIKRAHDARPDNTEYAQAYETIRKTSRRQGPIYTGGQMNDGAACLNCCTALICTDLCCNCLGGGC